MGGLKNIPGKPSRKIILSEFSALLNNWYVYKFVHKHWKERPFASKTVLKKYRGLLFHLSLACNSISFSVTMMLKFQLNFKFLVMLCKSDRV